MITMKLQMLAMACDTVDLMAAIEEENTRHDARLATLARLDAMHAISDASIATLDTLDARFDADPMVAR